MENVIYVGIGGFLGANARYVIAEWINGVLVPRWGMFPYGTLVVNTMGSFGIAIFSVWISERMGMSPQARLLVGTGFFGAFTTFSAFAYETIGIFEHGVLSLPIINIILNNGLCLLGVMAGLSLGHRLFSAA